MLLVLTSFCPETKEMDVKGAGAATGEKTALNGWKQLTFPSRVAKNTPGINATLFKKMVLQGFFRK